MRSDARLLLLDQACVTQLLLPNEVLEAVREAFILHATREGRTFPLVREHLQGGDIFGIKSGDVPSKNLLGFKAAGFWPGNRSRGGEPHQAVILLIDPATGRPVCLLDGNAITTVRTGAAGALGVSLLARPESARLCVFGTGVQARAQVSFALQTLGGVRELRYVTRDGKKDALFEDQFAGRCRVTHEINRNAAVTDSDVVITATPGSGPLFDVLAVRPGTHLNCVGADTHGKRELPERLLERARLFVDDRNQARQVGEAQWDRDKDCIELGDLLSGSIGTSRHENDITVFDMTGLALQDLCVAQRLYRRATEMGIGLQIAWPW